MGKIISNLSYRNDYKKCELNFEEAKPSDDAKAIFDLLKEMFEKSGRLKQELENYQDCTKEVREAMENPDDPEVVSRCFAVINERVAVGKRLYDFSLLAQNALDRFIEIFEPILSSTDALKPLLVCALTPLGQRAGASLPGHPSSRVHLEGGRSQAEKACSAERPGILQASPAQGRDRDGTVHIAQRREQHNQLPRGAHSSDALDFEQLGRNCEGQDGRRRAARRDGQRQLQNRPREEVPSGIAGKHRLPPSDGPHHHSLRLSTPRWGVHERKLD